MLTKKKAIAMATLVALAGHAVSALAEESEWNHEVHVYVGEMFGDDLTDRRVTGRVPELDDDVTLGLRYGYNFPAGWGLELSLGRANTSVTSLAGGDIDFNVTTFDVDGIYHFRPGRDFVPYVLAGVGYAEGDLDRALVGTTPGVGAVRIDDDGGFTFNAGVGAKWFLTDAVSVRLDLRYRYLDKVVDRFDDSLNTFETTVGVGFHF